MKTSSRNQDRFSGFVLLEVLIAILIFSIGVLGLIGLQATSAKHSTDAKYRSEAALLVNQLLGNMWVSDRTIATLQSNFNTGGSAYNAWLSSVTATLPSSREHGNRTHRERRCGGRGQCRRLLDRSERCPVRGPAQRHDRHADQVRKAACHVFRDRHCAMRALAWWKSWSLS
ncbi:MAG: type IV pilus modification protein PilV [Betaproteobacteria bacterium]|nr:type IV pilus modification protein PilV [Betaproteobacteria bacterium]